jgi:hypothetical protein
MLSDRRLVILSTPGQNLAAQLGLYDPATKTLVMKRALSLSAACEWKGLVLQNNSILFLGTFIPPPGMAGLGGTCPSTLYDPSTGQSIERRNVTIQGWGAGTAVLPGGKLLITGTCGAPPTQSSAVAQIYDPVKDTEVPTGAMVVPRCAPSMTVLNDGRVLVVGDQNGGKYSGVNSAEVYDPRTGRFTMVGRMVIGNRRNFVATLLKDGRVLIAGGEYFSSAEIFDPKTNNFRLAGSMDKPRYSYAAVSLDNGEALLAGGMNNGYVLKSSEVYHP